MPIHPPNLNKSPSVYREARCEIYVLRPRQVSETVIEILHEPLFHNDGNKFAKIYLKQTVAHLKAKPTGDLYVLLAQIKIASAYLLLLGVCKTKF